MANGDRLVLAAVAAAARRLSKDRDRRISAQTYQSMISIMSQAWRDTKGGRFSPVQPW